MAVAAAGRGLEGLVADLDARGSRKLLVGLGIFWDSGIFEARGVSTLLCSSLDLEPPAALPPSEAHEELDGLAAEDWFMSPGLPSTLTPFSSRLLDLSLIHI